MSDTPKTEKIVGVLGKRAYFRVLVWDKESGRAKLISRYGTEFVERIDELQRLNYVLTPGLQVALSATEGVKVAFRRVNGEPFDFPAGEF